MDTLSKIVKNIKVQNQQLVQKGDAKEATMTRVEWGRSVTSLSSSN